MRWALLCALVMIVGCAAKVNPEITARRAEILGRIQSIESLAGTVEKGKIEASQRTLEILSGSVIDLHVGGELDDDRIQEMLRAMREAGYAFSSRLTEQEWYELYDLSYKMDVSVLGFINDTKPTDAEVNRCIELLKKALL